MLFIFIYFGFSLSLDDCTGPLLRSQAQSYALLSSVISTNACSNITQSTCCSDNYYANFTTKFSESQKILANSAIAFNTSVQYFLSNLTLSSSLLASNSSIVTDRPTFENTTKLFIKHLGKCIPLVWRHMFAMKCLICDPKFSLYTIRGQTLGPISSTFTIKISNSNCQLLVEECFDFASSISQILNFVINSISQIREVTSQPFSASEKSKISSMTSEYEAERLCAGKNCTGLCSKYLQVNGGDLTVIDSSTDLITWTGQSLEAIRLLRESGATTTTTTSSSINRFLATSAQNLGKVAFVTTGGLDTQAIVANVTNVTFNFTKVMNAQIIKALIALLSLVSVMII